ncbi:rCG50928 [Rattus norvegicus]|uniref:RCG50928 n=1 Tax=Rattus norvegicus TaxID=10116 RepID=A6KJ45_RAT|nr:rCG50928 [Rattus norvegicus]
MILHKPLLLLGCLSQQEVQEYSCETSVHLGMSLCKMNEGSFCHCS